MITTISHVSMPANLPAGNYFKSSFRFSRYFKSLFVSMSNHIANSVN
jgi:hypothetical protein